MNTVELSLRIRALRKDKGMTLADLSKATGLTGSMLSKIENFRVTPSLQAVSSIADALGVSLSDLVRDLDAKPRIAFGPAGARRKVRRDGSPWTYWALVDDRSDRRGDPFIIEVPPSQRSRRANRHEGEEFMYLLEGELDLLYGGATYSLSPGDSVYADGSVEHTLINRTGEPAKLLVVFYRR